MPNEVKVHFWALQLVKGKRNCCKSSAGTALGYTVESDGWNTVFVLVHGTFARQIFRVVKTPIAMIDVGRRLFSNDYDIECFIVDLGVILLNTFEYHKINQNTKFKSSYFQKIMF